jgi:hypothetical protein
MADGKGCVCCAYNSSECACDADWTPQEVIDLRAENKKLRERIKQLGKMYKTKAKHVDHLLKQKRTKGLDTDAK